MYQLRDEDIPVVKAPNPILDRRAEQKQAQAEKLFLFGMPLPVVKRAQESANNGALVLMLVGLAAKLSKSQTVRIKPELIEQVGISKYQLQRALTALSDAGMIHCESARGKRREVEILDKEYLAYLGVNRTQGGRS